VLQPQEFDSVEKLCEAQFKRPWCLDTDLSIFGLGSWDASFSLGKAVVLVSKTADDEYVREVCMLRGNGDNAYTRRVARGRLLHTPEHRAAQVRGHALPFALARTVWSQSIQILCCQLCMHMFNMTSELRARAPLNTEPKTSRLQAWSEWFEYSFLHSDARLSQSLECSHKDRRDVILRMHAFETFGTSEAEPVEGKHSPVRIL
jgi:hypothetical protein